MKNEKIVSKTREIEGNRCKKPLSKGSSNQIKKKLDSIRKQSEFQTYEKFQSHCAKLQLIEKDCRETLATRLIIAAHDWSNATTKKGELAERVRDLAMEAADMEQRFTLCGCGRSAASLEAAGHSGWCPFNRK